ncbi:MAG: cyclic nucleotide-binding domain-containing protein [Actinomycetota bacterium]
MPGSRIQGRLPGEGDYFGEIGLLERIPRTATVRAVTDCKLYRITGKDFLATVNELPVISGALLGGLMTRLTRTHPSLPIYDTADASQSEHLTSRDDRLSTELLVIWYRLRS